MVGTNNDDRHGLRRANEIADTLNWALRGKQETGNLQRSYVDRFLGTYETRNVFNPITESKVAAVIDRMLDTVEKKHEARYGPSSRPDFFTVYEYFNVSN
ncbi:MAG: hypothetical protein JWP36_1327 [Paucimonas sp.]|nr:hypothetical protein [Paucimonas sp.]